MAGLLLQVINGVMLGGLYALTALGLTALFGVMRIVNFAYGTLFMLGGYVGYLVQTTFNTPFIVTILVAMAVMFVIGAGLELVAFRPLRTSEERTILLGLGIMSLGSALVITAFGSDNKLLPSGVTGRFESGAVVVTYDRIVAVALAAVIILTVAAIVKFSPAGRIVRAVAADPVRAGLLGISSAPVYTITFGVATALSAGAACLLATSWQVTPTIDNSALLISFVVVIVGGIGSIAGTLVAGVLVGVLTTLGEVYISQALAPAMPFVVLILVLLLRPQGLFGREARIA
jgi:branched-chain amino acid transport system permease protein